MKVDLSGFYKALAPRLAVLISTADREGRVNAAPFSFVMPVSMSPPLVAFASGRGKDTLENVRETGEFVINLPSEDILDKLWVCSRSLPRGVDELTESGLTEAASVEVKPPRIQECVAWFECKLVDEFEAGDHVIVLGEVVAAETRENVLDREGNLDVESAKILMHVGGPKFTVPGREVRAR